eukprot:2686402-Prymnesium_polylepis.2
MDVRHRLPLCDVSLIDDGDSLQSGTFGYSGTIAHAVACTTCNSVRLLPISHFTAATVTAGVAKASKALLLLELAIQQLALQQSVPPRAALQLAQSQPTLSQLALLQLYTDEARAAVYAATDRSVAYCAAAAVCLDWPQRAMRLGGRHT